MSGVLIMAGGTGGHVFPGLAVARRLRASQIPVAWLGTREGLEARLVPALAPDVELEWIDIRGVRGKGVLGWLSLPWRLARAMLQAFRVMRRRRPQAVLSLGGFVAGPGGLVAWLTRVPLLIHEQNAIPGLTNRWLAPFAHQVLTAFPVSFGLARAQQVGNPVRTEIAALARPEDRFKDRHGPLRLLVIGGSQGAAALNKFVPQAVAQLARVGTPLDVWHQCGRTACADVERAYESAPNARVSAFIEDMATAYAWADLVLCRAGAMTIAELAAVGVGAILVPFPAAVDDHQTANARFLVERDAAILLPQAELTPEHLAQTLKRLGANRDALLRMACAARAACIPNADETVARLCQEAMRA